MKLTRAALTALVSIATGVGGGVFVAQATNDGEQPSTRPASSNTQQPHDGPSEENLIRERLYYDVTGHSFSRVDPDPEQTLGPCTGDTTFSDVLPREGAETTGSKLVGPEGLRIIEQLAQTRSPQEARATAEEIVSLVDECAAIEGGDFGYGAPVTVQSNSRREVVYFPAYSSDRAAGGYIVFSVGDRIGVVDVADFVPTDQVAHLAQETVNIAAI